MCGSTYTSPPAVHGRKQAIEEAPDAHCQQSWMGLLDLPCRPCDGIDRQTDRRPDGNIALLLGSHFSHTDVSHSLLTQNLRCKHLLLGGWRRHRATCPGRKRAGWLARWSCHPVPSGDRTRRPPMLHAAPKGRKRLGATTARPGRCGIVGNDSSLPRASSCWLE